MIRFVANSGKGRLLGMGLSFANLDELRADRPIRFELGPHGSRGALVLAYGTTPLVAADPDTRIVTLTERTLTSLRAGEVITVPLDELAIPNLAIGLLFAAATEPECLVKLREAGLLPPGTPIDGLDDYERHQRNEVPDCAQCRDRTHGVAPVPRAKVSKQGLKRERKQRARLKREIVTMIAGLAALSAILLIAMRC